MNTKIKWQIKTDKVSDKYFPLGFYVKKMIVIKIKEKINDTKEKEKKVETFLELTGELNKEDWELFSQIPNLNKFHLTATIPFHCCDKCGAAFGAIDYPEGKFIAPDLKIFKKKEGNKTLELCESCFNRKNNIVSDS